MCRRLSSPLAFRCRLSTWAAVDSADSGAVAGFASATGFGATIKLLFDETVTEHLDIESIVFMSERLRQLLCAAPDQGGPDA